MRMPVPNAIAPDFGSVLALDWHLAALARKLPGGGACSDELGEAVACMQAAVLCPDPDAGKALLERSLAHYVRAGAELAGGVIEVDGELVKCQEYDVCRYRPSQ